MKQLLILSGKGGTGKTTIAASFISLLNAKAYADCDVDAPNLHLVAKRKDTPVTKDYFGLPKATIDPTKCTGCNLCYEHCKFDAINVVDGQYSVDYFACEGCSVCHFVCKFDAITMNDAKVGENMVYKQNDVFSTAQLKMGSGNSGLLVSEVKSLMKKYATADIAIIDGSPGIGCPVIASISGVDMVLVVAEPSISGISDLARIVQTSQGFGVTIAVCVNKSDTNEGINKDIKDYCQKNGLKFVGEIPFDDTVQTAINNNQPITDYDCPATNAVKKVLVNTLKIL